MGARIVAWLQIVGNFGVVLGLVLVAVQIRQSSELSRIQLAHDAWLLGQSLSIQQMGESPESTLAKIWVNGASLTDEDLVAADGYYSSLGSAISRIEYTNEAGLELYSTEAAAQYFAPWFETRFGRAWWQLNRERMAADAPQIRDRIDELLGSQLTDRSSYFERLREAVEPRKRRPSDDD